MARTSVSAPDEPGDEPREQDGSESGDEASGRRGMLRRRARAEPARKRAVLGERRGQLGGSAEVDVHRAHGQGDSEDRGGVPPRAAEADRDQVSEGNARAGIGGDRDRRRGQADVDDADDAEGECHRPRQVRAGLRNSPASWATASQPTNSHTRMLAAVPTAHHPWGANGVQLSPARDGSATETATMIAATSSGGEGELEA